MAETRSLRDPIHGFIKLTENDAKIIDTPLFQRLRRIKQLALAYLVYPGALHSRFEHSLGVFEVAGRMALKLGLSQDEIRLVKEAALLHDLGHGPFSHVSETILELYGEGNEGNVEKIEKEKIHEKLTHQIIQTHPDLDRPLSRDQRMDIVKILSENDRSPILKSIITGPLDADKQDYLLRDSYYCGVKYGIFDLDQLQREMCSIPDVAGEHYLMVDNDGVNSLEQYILAKYYLTNQVYRHRVRLITDEMIVRAVVLGIEEDNLDWLYNIYHYESTDKYMGEYLKWDDNEIFSRALEEKNRSTLVYNIMLRIQNRHLFKRVYHKVLGDAFNAKEKQILQTIMRPEKKETRSLLESQLCQNIEKECQNLGIAFDVTDIRSAVKNRYVILNVFQVKSVKSQSTEDESEIMIHLANNKYRRFEIESSLFRSINEKMNEYHV
ncbi:MAG: HD domain-containing protein [Myxococcales bacterium]|nr:HD domain-containing protein [Myxococcales bacterium]